MPEKRQLKVAMIGYGFMGAAHSQGWRVAPRFFDLDAQPVMQVLVGRNADAVADAATKWGWEETATDWRQVIARDDIDIIDIVTPGGSHAEIAIAALNAGKHVLCEKPLANSVEETELMAAAATAAAANGVISMLGHTYRRLPATTFARDLVAAGKIGDVHQVRACYLQDWLTDPETPLVWRLQKDLAGSGSLGDIGAHIIDLSEYITGTQLVEVSGTMETITKRRPVLESTAGLGGTGGTEMGDVTVDDVALFTGRYDSGVLGTFEATRFATGRKNALRIEISGSLGAISFDLERLNELQYFDATAPVETQGFTTILVTEPEHPYISAWWPAGHMLGYEHAFSHQAKDFVDSITSGTPASPSFDDGVHVQRVLAAVETSSHARSAWTTI
jgi:predicted dehydrogenase